MNAARQAILVMFGLLKLCMHVGIGTGQKRIQREVHRYDTAIGNN